MLSGTYYHPTRFLFGREMELKVGEEVRKHSQKVLFHYGKSSIKENGLYDVVLKSLTAEGVKVFELGGVEPNPKRALVYKGIDLCRGEGIDFILAVGGGSVIDSAKAISAGVPYKGDFFDFFEQKAKLEKSLKVGVILTLPGSGSESSPGAVITDPATRRKRVCDSPLLIPVFSILNPEYTVTLPKFSTSCGIVDAISHILERYFSNTPFVDCTDRICEGLLRTLIKYAAWVGDEPGNYDIRAEIMWACKLSHDITPGFGRKQDWACHKIAHEIGGHYDVPHGATIGVLFLTWMKWVLQENPEKLVQLGKEVFHIGNGSQAREIAVETILKFEEFLRSQNMPISLQALGIKDGIHFSEIAKKSVEFQQSGTVGNYIRLSPGDIQDLLILALKPEKQRAEA